MFIILWITRKYLHRILNITIFEANVFLVFFNLKVLFMKTLFFYLLTPLFFCASAQAQLVSVSALGMNRGIYFSCEDFQKNHPTETPQDCSKSDGFRIDDNFGLPVIKVKSSVNSFLYPAGTIYAFVDCYGRVYRYHNESYYQVIEMGAVNLYAKSPRYLANAAESHETEYFFSVHTDSEILPLEREYFIQAFSHHPEFAAHVDRNFYPNVSLKQFNAQSGMYEVARVFSQVISTITSR
jgi:hypothetical protein